MLAAAREQSLPLYLTGLAGAVLAAGYAARALGMALRRVDADARARWDAEQQGTRSVSVLERVPVVLLAAAAATLGLLELPPVADRLASAAGQASRVSAGWAELALSGVLAVVATVVVARFADRVPHPRWSATWLFTDCLPSMVTRRVLALARTLARVDDAGIDRAVTAAARGTTRIAAVVARLDDHGIDAVVAVVGRGTQRLGALARRPQTGQVHQYYAQAAVLLAAAVVVLAVVR